MRPARDRTSEAKSTPSSPDHTTHDRPGRERLRFVVQPGSGATTAGYQPLQPSRKPSSKGERVCGRPPLPPPRDHHLVEGTFGCIWSRSNQSGEDVSPPALRFRAGRILPPLSHAGRNPTNSRRSLSLGLIHPSGQPTSRLWHLEETCNFASRPTSRADCLADPPSNDDGRRRRRRAGRATLGSGCSF